MRSRSSFDSSEGESPVCVLSSFSPMLLRSRKRRSFSPMEYRFKPCVIVPDASNCFPLSQLFPCILRLEKHVSLFLYSKASFL